MLLTVLGKERRRCLGGTG